MDLKKLYKDACVLACEMPIYSFLTYCDCFARHVIAAYGKRYAVGEGEYLAPCELGSSYAICDAFYNAALFYIVGAATSNAEMLEKSNSEAESAYRTLWREGAHGKRIKGAEW